MEMVAWQKLWLTLRRLTREGDAEPYINMLNKAQEFVSKKLYSSNAFNKHDEGHYLKIPS
jgi:hypothetical protein